MQYASARGVFDRRRIAVGLPHQWSAASRSCRAVGKDAGVEVEDALLPERRLAAPSVVDAASRHARHRRCGAGLAAFLERPAGKKQPCHGTDDRRRLLSFTPNVGSKHFVSVPQQTKAFHATVLTRTPARRLCICSGTRCLGVPAQGGAREGRRVRRARPRRPSRCSRCPPTATPTF